MRWQVAANLLWQAGRRTRRAPTGWEAALRHLGAFGLFAFAVLDSSPLPTFGGLDLLTAILAARHVQPWYFYAMVATAGALVGCFITYEIARKAGEAYLTEKFGEDRVRRLLRFVRQWGGGTLVVSTLLPPPFPTTVVFAAAGILEYPTRRYLTAVAAGRAVRYGLIAWAGATYGRHFVRLVRHPERYLGWSAVLGSVLLVMLAGGIVIWLAGRHGKMAEQQESKS